MKSNLKIDLCFLIVFFIILFIPVSKINHDKKAQYENRYLSEFKPLFYENKFNYDFGKNFDDWFGDRFNFRNELINLAKRIEFYSANKAQKSNFLALPTKTKAVKPKQEENKEYYIDNENKIIYINREFWSYSDVFLNKAFEEISKFEKFLSENKIKFYLLLVPSKIYIYPTKIRKYRKDFLDEFNYYKEKTGLNIIYPLEELRKESKNNYVFFKTDHHWTDDGAYIGYQELMKAIKKDYPKVKITTRKDYDYFYSKKVRGDFKREFTNGDSCQYLNISDNICDEFLNVKYRYYKHKNFNALKTKTTDKPKKREKEYYYPYGLNKKVILYGTSMSENLGEFLPFSFKNVRRIRNNIVQQVPPNDEFKIMKYHKEEILNYKPDIFIMCLVIPNLMEIKKIFAE